MVQDPETIAGVYFLMAEEPEMIPGIYFLMTVDSETIPGTHLLAGHDKGQDVELKRTQQKYNRSNK